MFQKFQKQINLAMLYFTCIKTKKKPAAPEPGMTPPEKFDPEQFYGIALDTEQIAFAFLDGDFYESIKDSIKLVAPKMSDGGVMVVHDYTNPALPGVKRAVDEWMQKGTPQFEVVLL